MRGCHAIDVCVCTDHSQLQKKYPYMKLKVVAHAVKPPTINVKQQGANVTLPANIDVYVLDTATNSTPLAFTIGVVGLHTTYSRIHAMHVDFQIHVRIMHTSVGHFFFLFFFPAR